MDHVPVDLLVASFETEEAAEDALQDLQKAKKENLIGIRDVALIRRDYNNKIHIKDVRDVSGARGALAGGIFGAAIALLAGPAGVILSGAAGALVGGLVASKVDMGLPNKRLKELGETLKPGSSAIVAVIEYRWAGSLEKDLMAAGAKVTTDALEADIARQMAQGEHPVTQSAPLDDEVVVEVENIVATEDGVAADVTVKSEEGTETKKVLLDEVGLEAGS